MLELETKATDHLREEGYVVLRGVLDVDEDIQPLIDEYGVVLDTLIDRLYAQGRLRHRYDGLSVLDRLSAFLVDTGDEHFQHLSVHLPFHSPAADHPLYLHPAMFNLLRSPRLLDALEQFIGPEIAVNPLHITRIKPPERRLPEGVQSSANGAISKTLWHQDLWAFQTEADQTDVITVWVPMVAADEENGCLAVVPGSHRPGELSTHCKSTPQNPSSKGIPEQIVSEDRKPLPAAPGDRIVMDKLTQHCSLVNVSDRLRWSFDLRYQVAGQPAGQGGREAWTARSRTDPESEMRDFEEWETLWRNIIAREATDGVKDQGRYSLNDPLCV